MPNEQEFLDQLFGGTRKPRRLGEPLRRAKLPSLSDDDGDEIDFVSDAERFRSEFGLNFSSTFRSADRNAKVGGKPNSYHLRGEAADIPTAGMSDEIRNKTKSYWASLGNYDVIDEGDHIHVEPRPGIRSKSAFGKGDSSGASESPEKSKQDTFLDQLFNSNKPKPDFSNVSGKVGPTVKRKSLSDSISGWLREQYAPTKDGFSVVPRFFREPIEKKAAQIAQHASTRLGSINGSIKPDDPNYNPPQLLFGSKSLKPTLEDYERADPYIEQRLAKKRSDKLAEEGVAAAFDGPPPAGFVEQMKSRSIVDLILNNSLPANAIEWASGKHENGYQKLKEAKATLRQDTIVAHPEQYAAAEVQAARKAVDDRKAKQGRGIAGAWDDLKKAASEDPGKFGAVMLQSLIADPEMLLAPIGIGAKPIQATKGIKALTTGEKVTSTANRAARIADGIIDAGITGGGLNVAIEAAQRGSEGQDFSAEDAATSFGVGAAMSAPFGALGKGRAAAEKLASGNVTKETLNDAINDVAGARLATEDILNDLKSPNTFVNIKHQIERATGVKFEAAADLEAYLKSEQLRWEKLFKERDLNGQLQAATAEERILRRQTLLEEQQGREARAAADSEKAREVDIAYAEDKAARLARFNDDYEKALAQRDSKSDASIHEQALAENDLRAAQSKIDQQDIIQAAIDDGVPEIKNAMLRAAQRDSKLRVPKWQRGEVDPRTLTRLGIGALFAGTAYAVANDENKPGAALAAGLAGLTIPGAGGNVLRKMRQAGAVTEEGMVTGLFKNRSPSQQLEFDTGVIERAKQGDQQAFQELFNDNYGDIVRFANRKLYGVSGKLGMDGEDIANEVFAKAFSKLGEYESRVPYNAYLKKLASDEVVDAIRRITAEKRGADFAYESMYNKFDSSDKTPAIAGEDAGGYRSSIRGDVEAAAVGFDSPEFQAEFMDTANRLNNIVDSLPDKQQQAFKLLNVDNLEIQEAAIAMGESYDNVQKLAKRAELTIVEKLEKGYGARKVEPTPQLTDDNVKRGRGRPRKQVGEVDPKLLKIGAKIAIAGLAGFAAANVFTDTTDAEGNPRSKDQFAPIISGLGTAGLAAFMMLSKGKGGSAARSMTQAVDELFGSSSTRILNKSEKIFGAIQHTIRATAGETHRYIESTTPFLRRVSRLPGDTQDILARALYTGKAGVTDKILSAIGDAELTESYKAVRATLDSLGDKLVNLKRFSKGAFEYFPRIIKDRDGLFNAIGKTKADDVKRILEDANVDSLKRSGKSLTGYEENALINSILFGGDHKSLQPGWAKARGVEEITEELLPFYATPAESLHSYIRSAVADIEKAKFFGQYARNAKIGKYEFLDVDASVGLMLRDDIYKGKMTPEEVQEVTGIVKDFFGKGQMGESEFIRRIKDISYIGLLGNFLSTVTQLADIPVAIYTQDLRSTIGAVVRQATGRKVISAKELGLVDNVSQEFAGQERSTRALNSILKKTLFSSVDQIGKNTVINAAVLRAQRLVNSEDGVTKLSSKYGEIFGKRFNTLVSDLKAGRISDEVKDYAWMELSRTQPISMLEMPQKYMKHPNARSYLMLKSFVIKQIDLARRDALQNIATKDPRKIARGIRNLTEMTIVMGASGAGTQMVKDWLQGKDVKFELTDIPINMVKNLGWSGYQIDKFKGVTREEAKARREAGDTMARARKATPVIAALEFAMPPAQIFDDILRGDTNAVRYVVPGAGPWVAKKLKDIAEMDQENTND